PLPPRHRGPLLEPERQPTLERPDARLGALHRQDDRFLLTFEEHLRIGVVIFFALSAAAVAADTRRSAYVLITHPGNPISRLDRKFVAEIFLRRTTRWPDDSAVHPVDLGPDAPVRSRFPQEILSRSVASVSTYWSH